MVINLKTRLSPDISGVENFGSSISGGKLDCIVELLFTDLVVDDVSAAAGIVGGGKLNNNSIKTLLLAFIQFSLSFDGMLLIMVFSFGIFFVNFRRNNNTYFFWIQIFLKTSLNRTSFKISSFKNIEAKNFSSSDLKISTP